MRIIYKGMRIDNKIEEKRVEQLLHDDNIHKLTKITVKIPSDNFTLTLIPSVDNITEEGLVSWGDNTGGYLNDTRAHVYEKAGVYDIIGQFVLGLGVECTTSMKNCLVEVKNLSQYHENLINAFANCWGLISFNTVTKINPTSLYRTFAHCKRMINADMTNIYTDNTTTLAELFTGCNLLKELNVSHWNTSNVTNMGNLFNACTSLNSLDVNNWDTSKVTNMNNTFGHCKSLISLDVGEWDVSKVEDFNGIFYGCQLLQHIEVNNWSTDSAKQMNGVFRECHSLISVDLSNWTTTNVSTFGYMFVNCKELIEIKGLQNLNTSNLTDLSDTFNGCLKLQNVSGIINWDTSKVTTMTRMFKNCKAMTSLDLSSFDTTKLGSLSYTFEGCTGLTSIDLSSFNNANLGYLNSTFKDCVNLTTIIGIGNLSVVNVRNMDYTFYGCEKLANLDLSKWVTSQYLTSMAAMFADCKSLTSLNVSGFVTNNVTTIVGKVNNVDRGLFSQCNALTEIIGLENWNTKNINNMYELFWKCANLINLNLTGWDTSNVTNMYRMINGCHKLETLTGIGGFRTGKVTNMQSLFYGCRSLRELEDLSGWDVSKVTSMRTMFAECYLLSSIPGLENWDTSNVTTMYSMFYKCENLEELNLSNWNTANVTDMFQMFNGCGSLTTLSVDNWDVSKVTDMGLMFLECNLLKSLDLSNWNTYRNTNMRYMFANCYELEYLDITKFNTANVTSMYGTFRNCYKLDKIDVSHFNTNKVTTIEGMFHCCKLVKILDVTNWNTSKITNMNAVFNRCENLMRLNLSNWIVDKVTSMRELFYQCMSIKSISGLENWNTSKVTDMSYMFTYCNSLVDVNVDGFNTSNVTNMFKMFTDCLMLPSIDVSNWNVGKVTNMNNMFTNCKQITTVGDIGNWNTSNVTNMAQMFAWSEKLEQLNVSGWNVSKVTNMQQMFNTCRSLVSIEGIGNWVAPNLTNIAGMFCYCDNLTTLDLSGFDISKVTTLGIMQGEDFKGLFKSCKSLTSIIGIDKWDVSNVNDMREIFRDCIKLSSLDVSKWDTSNVINMSRLFYSCRLLTSLDVSNWDVSNVNYMDNMFRECQSLTSIDVSKWDTGSVTDMYAMFYDCRSLTSLDLSNFDTSNVTNISSMFNICTKLTSLDLSNFVTSNVTTMSHMFYGCNELTSIGDISNWNTSKVTDMGNLFNACNKLSSLDVSNFDTSKVTNMSYMFNRCDLLPVINVSNWDVGNVTNMDHMFAGCRIITLLDLSSWDVSNVTNMKSLFDNCYMLTSIGDISNWDTGNVTDMGAMFSYCQKINGLNVSNWDVRNVTQMYYMFNECFELTSIDVSKWNTESLQTAHWMFRKCQKITSLDVSNWDVSNVTAMSHMFQHCNQLRTVGDLGNWDTRNVTVISNMFDCCGRLESLNVSNFDTSKVTNMSSVFTGCEIIPELDVSNWDTRNVTTMDRMFYNCKSLTSIDVSNWNTSKVTTMYNMFAGCNNVTALDVSNWNTGNVTNMQAMFIDCWSITSLDIRNWDTRNVTTMEKMFNTCKLLTEIKGIEDINTSKVTTILLMFYMTKIPTLDLSRWDTGNMKYIGGFVQANRALTSLNVSTWNTSKVTDMGRAFCNCSGLTELDLSSWDTRNVTNMVKDTNNEVIGLFAGCTNLRSITFGENWDTSKVTNMAYMFKGCQSLTSLDVSNWNTSNVTDMQYMFHTCQNLTSLDVSKWDTSNVTNLKMMFHYCTSLTTLDVSKWDTSNVLSIENTFQSCAKLTDINISNWNMSSVKSIHAVLHNCVSLTNVDISGWEFNDSIRASVSISGLNRAKTIYLPKKHVDIIDIVYTENNQPMHGFLENCTELTTIDFGGFDLTNAEDDLGLFMKNAPNIKYVRCDIAGTLNKIVNYLPVRTVEAPGCLITTASVTNEILSVLNSKNWNIVSLEQDGTKLATYTFDKSVYSSHVPQFNNSPNNEYGNYDGYFWNDVVDGNLVTRTLYTLRELPTLMRFGHIWIDSEDDLKYQPRSHSLIDVEYVNVEGLTNMSAMFRACKNLVRVNEFKVTNKVQYIGALFQHCTSLTSLDVSNWDTRNVTYMAHVFSDCQSLTSLDLSNFDTSKVNRMDYMFNNCNKLTSLDVSNFDTSKVISMDSMFCKCTSLTSLDVSNFNTSNVTNMASMFYWLNVEYLDLRNFNTSKVETMTGMFDNCPLLKEIKGIEDLDTGKVNDMRQMFFNCNALTSLDLSRWDTSNVRLMNGLFFRCFNLESLNVSTWNTANVTDMTSMFRGLRKLTSIDVSSFNTRNVTNMSWMFAGLEWDRYPSSLTEIIGLENWDTSNVINMGAMFLGCDKITELKVDNWNVNKVVTASSLFNSCTSLVSLDLSKWTFSNKLENIVYMFRNCESLTEININGLNTVNVVHLTNLFYNCRSIKYLDCSSINIDTLSWNGDLQLGYLFGRMTSLTNLNISQLDLTNIDEYESMFIETPNLELISCNKIGTVHKIIPLIPNRTGKDHGILLTTISDEIDEECMELLAEKNWEIATEIGMLVADYVFDPEIYPSLLPVAGNYLNNCVIVDEIIENYVVEETIEEVEVLGFEEENYGVMTLEEPSFRRAIRRKIYNVKEKKPSYVKFGTDTWNIRDNQSDSLLEVKYLDIENCTDLYRLFGCCWNLRKVEGMVVTNNTTILQQAFHGCYNLISVNTEGWNTSNVKNMQGMFQNCYSLTSIDVSNWDTSKNTSCYHMFSYCQSLASLNLSTFDTSKVTDMRRMFYGCSSLTSLDLSTFDTSKVTTGFEHLFQNCSRLTIVDISNFTINEGCELDAMIGNAPIKYLKLDDVPSLIRIIDQLPTKTSVDKAHVVTYNPPRLTNININLIKAKNWEIHSIDDCTVAAYGFDNTIHDDLMPIFNEDYDTSALVISDHVHGGYFVHRDIMNFEGKLPSSIKFGGDEPDTRTNALMQIGDVNLTGMTDYSEMFKNCTNLNYLNICVGEKTPTNVSHMFEGCSNLELFDIYGMNYDGITSYEGMFAGCNKLCKIRVKDIQNVKFINILQDKNNNFANDRELVSSHVHDLTEEEIGVIEGLGWGLKGMVAHYAYDNIKSKDYLPVFNEEFIDFEIFDYLNERQGIMHRTIESNMLPTLMKFGLPAGEIMSYNLLEVYDMDTRELTTGASMFGNCISVSKILCDWKTSKMTDMSRMFAGCQKMSYVDVSNFDTSNVTNMNRMFHCCHMLSEINVSGFDTSKVTDMTNMFYGYLGTKTLDVSGFDTSNVTTMLRMFYNCNAITELDVSGFDTSKVTHMGEMFFQCRRLTSLDVSNWDTSNVTAMYGMFDDCQALTSLDVSNWDTSKVETMYSIFLNCGSLKFVDTSRWNVDKVKDMLNIFNVTQLDHISLSNWSMLKGELAQKIDETTQHNEFIGSGSLISIDFNNCIIPPYDLNWMRHTPNLKLVRCNDADSIVNLLPHLLDRSIVTTQEVVTYEQKPVEESDIMTLELDYEEPELVPVVNTVTTELDPGILISDAELSEETLAALAAKNWTVVTSDSFIKVAEYVYDPDVWTSFIPEFNAEFIGYFIDDEEIEGEAANGTVKTLIKRTIWSLGELPTLMRFGTFWASNAIDEREEKRRRSLLEILYLNTDNMTNMIQMFRLCDRLRYINCNFNTSNVSGSYMYGGIFAHCESLTSIDLSTWDVSNITTLDSIFFNCINLKTIKGLEKWDIRNNTSLWRTFQGCRKLENVDVSNWDTSNVIDMDSVFRECYVLTSLDVSKWNTSNVTSMYAMFDNCNKLTSLDVSNFDTSKVTNIGNMFNGCNSLTSIDVSNWNTSSVTGMNYVFKNDYKLENIDISNWDTSKVTTFRDFIGDCFEIERLDLSSFTGESCNSVEDFLYFNNDRIAKLKSIDISNMIIHEGISYTNFLYVEHNELANLTDIGMVHCDVRTINIVAGMTPVQPITIWIGTHLTADEIASLDQYDHITYSIQLENAERLLLSSPLLEGDEIKVVDGQLCHVHNMGMKVIDKFQESGNEYYVHYLGEDTGFKQEQYKHAKSNYFRFHNGLYPAKRNAGAFIGTVGVGVPFNTVDNISLSEFNAMLQKEPLVVIYELAEPWTEVIDLPNESIDLPLYENGVLYMSDPTASTNRADSNGRMLIDAVQGDSVVNVSNQQLSIELSEENNIPIQTGEILEDNAIRPKFYGRTMVNLMDRIGWEKLIHTAHNYGAYVYNAYDITNKSITITNFNDKPIKIGIYNSEVQSADGRGVDIAANSSVTITLSEVESLFSVIGVFVDGWTEENIHELKNVNIFEGELSEDELPENRMNGMRNAFDKYQTSEGKYRVEMVVSNSPIQFGKAGRK